MKAQWILILLLMAVGSILADEPLQGSPCSNETAGATSAGAALEAFRDGRFAWRASGPFLAADKQAADPQVSIKDPTFVQYGGVWHLFATLRMQSGKVDIVYLNFKDWSASNMLQDPPWTATSISHGELVRVGTDETMEVDPANIRFVFQGADDSEYRGNSYGKIPWRLGMLESVK